MLQDLRNDLVRTRQILLGEIGGLDAKAFNGRPSEDRWSIGQVCHHLVLLERYFTVSARIAMASAATAVIPERQLEGVKDRSFKVESPDFAAPSSDVLNGDAILEMLEESRTNLWNEIDRIKDESAMVIKGFEHPLIGLLSLKQWLQFIAYHELRHIEQIRELKSWREGDERCGLLTGL